MHRLLENGAKTSFVNRHADEEAPVADIIRDPVEVAESEREMPPESRPPGLPLPRDIFLPGRLNSIGLPLREPTVRAGLQDEMRTALEAPFAVGPIVDGEMPAGGDELVATWPRRALCVVAVTMSA